LKISSKWINDPIHNRGFQVQWKIEDGIGLLH
jgi:hypothetical protein